MNTPAPHAVLPGKTASLAGRLFPDYPPAAIVYWCATTLAGIAALAWSIGETVAMPAADLGRALTMAGIAVVVGLFPLRIPKTKHSIAAGDIFIFLLLLLNGVAVATVAAAAESAVIAARTSRRWTSRIASPAMAALAMSICGSGYERIVAALAGSGRSGERYVFVALMAFALAYFLVGPTLVTAVAYLKRKRLPTLNEWASGVGWIGMGYAASASVAGVLYLAFREFGLEAVLFAVPMTALFLATLHYYFAQQEAVEREAAERSSRERAEAAEREAAQSARHLRDLERSDRRFHSAFTHAAIGMALISHDGRVVQANRALCALLGRDATDVVGATFLSFVEAGDAERLARNLARLGGDDTGSFQIELRCRHEAGHELWVSMHGSAFADGSSEDSHLILQAFDITARRKAEARLQHLAYHDNLTNLANRAGLLEAMGRAISARDEDPLHQFSLMHLNFDCFKRLNESLGHEAGDEFLRQVARRLEANARDGAVLARLSGDEFALLDVYRARGTHHAITHAERLQEAFRAPIMVGETEVSAGLSIGITFSDVDYKSADDALRDATFAMSKAKASGKARVAVFDATLHERATERLQLETELRRALDTDQLTLVFQPIFELASRRLVGFEALSRWRHPERGPISPVDFIPIAEESGLIGEITRRALEHACSHLSGWRACFPSARDLFVNVNICGHDLGEASFADQVRETLRRHRLPASALTLEITETTLMQQLDMGSRTLARLYEHGVRLSVDDFGTGYSSLSHLSRLPISSLKIDRSFVQRMLDGTEDAEIVRAVVRLGEALAIRVVAEGIETERQAERLLAFGCAYGQGFLLARPLEPLAAQALLESRTTSAPETRAPGPLVPELRDRVKLVV